MKGKAYKWWLLALLFVTFFLELGSRQLYNAALPQIKEDFAHLAATIAKAEKGQAKLWCAKQSSADLTE